ncbi:unnamed protein product [Heligmosomoides polygyrus]|uniref:Secreted protein n=1 Tax=Heligmosomoides polygyrus TaxID=6339 RepID=A0A183FWT5_HELPZ|nr:unnamed protein product [Heligmosomoides polygyrus]
MLPILALLSTVAAAAGTFWGPSYGTPSYGIPSYGSSYSYQPYGALVRSDTSYTDPAYLVHHSYAPSSYTSLNYSPTYISYPSYSLTSSSSSYSPSDPPYASGITWYPEPPVVLYRRRYNAPRYYLVRNRPSSYIDVYQPSSPLPRPGNDLPAVPAQLPSPPSSFSYRVRPDSGDDFPTVGGGGRQYQTINPVQKLGPLPPKRPPPDVLPPSPLSLTPFKDYNDE